MLASGGHFAGPKAVRPVFGPRPGARPRRRGGARRRRTERDLVSCGPVAHGRRSGDRRPGNAPALRGRRSGRDLAARPERGPRLLGPARGDGGRLRRPPGRRRRPVPAHRRPGLPARRRAVRRRPHPRPHHHPRRQRLPAGRGEDGRRMPPVAAARRRRRVRGRGRRRGAAGGGAGGRGAWPRTRPPRCWPLSAMPWPKRTSCRPTPSCWSGPAASREPRAARSSAAACRTEFLEDGLAGVLASWRAGRKRRCRLVARRRQGPCAGRRPTATTATETAMTAHATASTLTRRTAEDQRRAPARGLAVAARWCGRRTSSDLDFFRLFLDRGISVGGRRRLGVGPDPGGGAGGEAAPVRRRRPPCGRASASSTSAAAGAAPSASAAKAVGVAHVVGLTLNPREFEHLAGEAANQDVRLLLLGGI